MPSRKAARALRPIRVLIWGRRAAKSHGVFTAGAVANHFLSGPMGNFTRYVFERTNGVAPVNSDGEYRRSSKHGCRSNSAPSAE